MALSKTQKLERVAGRIAPVSERRTKRTHESLNINGKTRQLTIELREALHGAAVKAMKFSKSKPVKTATAGTRAGFKSMMAKHESVGHSQAYIDSVTERTLKSGDVDVGAALLEGVNPALTGTKLGLYALDVSEKLGNTPTVSGIFVDAVLLDEANIAFFFTKSETVNENAIERALQEFGVVENLAKPGDEIAEGIASDLHVVSITVDAKRLKDIVVNEEFAFNEDGVLVLDEASLLPEEDADALVSDSAFSKLKALIS